MSEEAPKYKITHSFTKAINPKDNFAKDKEDFFYSVQGDDMKEVIKDLQEIKKEYPPITHKEKVEQAIMKGGKDTNKFS